MKTKRIEKMCEWLEELNHIRKSLQDAYNDYCKDDEEYLQTQETLRQLMEKVDKKMAVEQKGDQDEFWRL
jgi:predicted patatin/cPLA2 family phospholipase